MTTYVGENIIITHTATLDGTALDDTDVTAVNIEIVDSAGANVIAETAMTWDSGQSRWEYDWDTSPSATPITAGTYKAKVTIVGLDSSENFEIKRIRLATTPV